MPKIYTYGEYVITIWQNENGEPIHVHVSKKSEYADAWSEHIKDPASTDTKKIQLLMDDNAEFVQDIFSSFIQALCSHVVNDLCTINRQDLSEEAAPKGLRFHARYYNRKTSGGQQEGMEPEIVEQFKQFCFAPYSLPEEYLPSDISWKGSLIQAAFESGKSLIFQNNQEHSIPPNRRWGNFITIIPAFPQNVISTNQGKSL